MESNKIIKANGHNYFVLDELSINRYIKYEDMSVDLGLGNDPATLFKSMADAYKALTSGNNLLKAHKDACESLLNGMKGIEKLTDQPDEHKVLLFCTLFMVRDTEDLTQWDERLAVDKIADWTKEGLPMTLFFSLAKSAILKYQETYDLHKEMVREAKNPKPVQD
jgi:hypothetical protein